METGFTSQDLAMTHAPKENSTHKNRQKYTTLTDNTAKSGMRFKPWDGYQLRRSWSQYISRVSESGNDLVTIASLLRASW